MMRMKSKPGCSKKRLSSAESSACTITLGMSSKLHAAPLLARAVEKIGQ